MAEITAILPVVSAVTQAVNIIYSIAKVVQKYRAISNHLFDIYIDLHASRLILSRWLEDWGVTEGTTNVYYECFFGQGGWRVIRATHGEIQNIIKRVNSELDGVVHDALKQANVSSRERYRRRYDRELFQQAIENISRSTTMSRKLKLTFWSTIDDLESEMTRLGKHLENLHRMSEYYSEHENPDVFGPLNSMPTQKKRLMLEWPKPQEGDWLQRDAKYLREAYAAGDRLEHQIGLLLPAITNGQAYPQGRKLDPKFQILLRNGTAKSTVLARPVAYREDQRRRLQSSLSSTLSPLNGGGEEEAHLLPPQAPVSHGYLLKVTPDRWLSELERGDSLAKILAQSRDVSNRARLSMRDRTAIAMSLVEGCFRLLGSEWLDNLDAGNIRGKKHSDGSWMTILGSEAGERSTTRTLAELAEAEQRSRSSRSLAVHCQIFRLGLILTELILRVPITYIDKDPQKPGARIWIKDLEDDPMEAMEIAARVDGEINTRLLGDIVFFCLSSMQERAAMRDPIIANKFYRKALIPYV